MMMMRTAPASPRFNARIAGVFYSLNIVTIFLAIFFFRGLVVSGDPTATAANVLAHETRFRLGYALELISTACSIVVAALFYELFKPVNRSLSLLAALFRLIGCALAAVGYLFQLAALQVLAGPHYLNVLKTEGLQVLALLLFSFQARATNILIVFFGFHFLLIGYLILRSTFLPGILGALVAAGGLAGLIFLVPPLGIRLFFPYFAGIGLLCEVSPTLWLVVVGVNVQRWQELARAAAVPIES